jgi:antitoxin HigA-1
MAGKAKIDVSSPTPGEVLKQYIIDANRATQEQLAEAMGVSRLTVNQLINGKRSVTAEMALRLARVLSTTPDFWLNLQRNVDLLEAERKLVAELRKMPVLRHPERHR